MAKQDWIDFGMQAGQSIIGTGLGLALQRSQDVRQVNQQRKLQALQIQGQKEMTDYQMQKQLQMWKDTNYGAQMEQLKIAGLNPGLIYGMSGGGATTAGNAGGNVTGTHAPAGGGEALHMAQTAAQMGLLRAQKENIEADTANKKADIPVKGADVNLKNTQAASLIQGIENEKTRKSLMEIQDSLLRQELWEKYTSQDDRMQAYSNLAKEGIERAKQAMIQTGVDEKTQHDKIKLLAAQAIGQAVQNTLGGKQIQLNQQAWEQNIDNMILKWRHDSREGQQLLIRENLATQGLTDVSDPVVNMIQDIINGIVLPIPTKRNPVGFKQ